MTGTDLDAAPNQTPSIFFRTASGAFSAPLAVEYGSNIALDVNGDGRADMIAVNSSTGTIIVELGEAHTVQHTVSPVLYTSTTTLSASQPAALASQTIRLVATVSTTGNENGGQTIGSGKLEPAARALLDTNLLQPGTHSLTATYYEFSLPPTAKNSTAPRLRSRGWHQHHGYDDHTYLFERIADSLDL